MASPTHRRSLLALSLVALVAVLAGCTPRGGAQPPGPSVVSPQVTAASASPVAQPTPTRPPATPTVPPAVSPLVLPSATATPEAAVYGYRVVAEYPHDPTAWTQGLVVLDGDLIEGTGLRGQSTLREVDLETGEVLRSIPLAPEFFGEGVAVFGDRIYQLTWQENIGLIYDLATFGLLDTWRYPGEGWGLTHDGQNLIMSDGTATLRFLDPDTQEVVRQVEVPEAAARGLRLNELEYVDGEVWANVWLSDLIVRIDPADGRVVGWIDLRGLFTPQPGEEGVKILNGIAYEDQSGRLFVTGKWWPSLFEIELVPMK